MKFQDKHILFNLSTTNYVIQIGRKVIDILEIINVTALEENKVYCIKLLSEL